MGESTMTDHQQPEVVNVEQAQAWDGDEGAHWAANAHVYNGAVVRHDPHLFEGAAIDVADRVLDVGCGVGVTTLEAARRASSGSATGIDLSRRMLDMGRGRAAGEGLTNVAFVHGDAQVFPFERAGFDVVISRYGAMFFGDAVAAFANIGAALRPGGHLALLTWRTLPENEWLSTIRGTLAAGRDLPLPPPDAPSPFGLSDPTRVKDVLTTAGFDGVELTPVDEPMTFLRTADETLAFLTATGVAKGLLDGLDADTRAGAVGDLRAALAEHETPEGVSFGSAAWLVTATSTAP
jgi:SAM-dependent methyltransferase